MSQENVIAGSILVFGGKTLDEDVLDTSLLIEVTDFTKDGRLEIAFNDRGERTYLKFSLADVIKQIATLRGGE